LKTIFQGYTWRTTVCTWKVQPRERNGRVRWRKQDETIAEEKRHCRYYPISTTTLRGALCAWTAKLDGKNLHNESLSCLQACEISVHLPCTHYSRASLTMKATVAVVEPKMRRDFGPLLRGAALHRPRLYSLSLRPHVYSCGLQRGLKSRPATIGWRRKRHTPHATKRVKLVNCLLVHPKLNETAISSNPMLWYISSHIG
jgi:hypothetical protein